VKVTPWRGPVLANLVKREYIHFDGPDLRVSPGVVCCAVLRRGGGGIAVAYDGRYDRTNGCASTLVRATGDQRRSRANTRAGRPGGSGMPTGKKAGKAAGKVLSNPKSTTTEKRAAASDLAQRPRSAKKGRK
jgi:hypothetical protein